MVPSTEVKSPAAAPAPDEGDILLEQLEYLIEHTQEGGMCACTECERYARVRAALLEIFE
jgi:hypothetical protein